MRWGRRRGLLGRRRGRGGSRFEWEYYYMILTFEWMWHESRFVLCIVC
jgi:hypothetical protein